MRCKFVAILLLLLPTTTFAGPPRPTVSAADQVQALLAEVREAPSEDRRSAAAEGLEKYSAEEWLELVPTLIDALVGDSSPQVRRAAARALGRVRPRTQEALDALTQAAEEDESWRVRQVARIAKFGYRVEKPKAQLTSVKSESLTLHKPKVMPKFEPASEQGAILAAPRLTGPRE